MTTLYNEALSKTPGLTEAQAALREAQKLAAAAATAKVDDGMAELIAKGSDALVKGKALPTAADALKARHATDLKAAQIELTRGVMENLTARVAALKADKTAPLAFLASKLDALMAEVAEADQALGSVSSATEAVESDDTAAAWRVCAKGVREYAEIRGAVQELYRDVPGLSAGMRATIPYLTLLSSVGWSSNPKDWEDSQGHKEPFFVDGADQVYELRKLARSGTARVVTDPNVLQDDWERMNAPVISSDEIDVNPGPSTSKEATMIRKMAGMNFESSSDICRKGRQSSY